MYRYFNICADERYDGFVDPAEALRHVFAVEKLEQKSPVEFEYADGGNWYLVLLLNCDRDGNYSSDGMLPGRVNLIEVTSRMEADRAANFARTLAERLGWLVIEVTEN